MTIATTEEYIEKVQLSLGDLKDQLDEDAIEFAIDQTLSELQWTLPISVGTRPFWAVQRARRHCLDILRTTSAYKFKYKQINLNQRFEHLNRMIWALDIDFKTALKYDTSLFDVNIEDTFGTYLGNNMIYDSHGNDITKILMKEYNDDNDGYRTRVI